MQMLACEIGAGHGTRWNDNAVRLPKHHYRSRQTLCHVCCTMGNICFYALFLQPHSFFFLLPAAPGTPFCFPRSPDTSNSPMPLMMTMVTGLLEGRSTATA